MTPGGSLQAGGLVYVGETLLAAPWYRQISRDQWRAFWATFMGWLVDAFDFNILAFVLIDIQKSFTVDRALAGALGTVTLVMRAFGGVLAGSGGQVRPQVAAGDIHSLVLALCLLERFLAIIRDALRAARTVRHWHGWRMGRRYPARTRALAGTIPWIGIWYVAGGIFLGLSAGCSRVPNHLSHL